MDATDTRAARSQVLFRQVNERIEHAARAVGFDGPTLFVCECRRIDCAEAVQLAPAEFAAVRERPNHFAVVPGHVVEEAESVIDDHGHYVVIEVRLAG